MRSCSNWASGEGAREGFFVVYGSDAPHRVAQSLPSLSRRRWRHRVVEKKAPLLQQRPRSRGRRGSEEQRQVGGRVDIERDAWEPHHRRLDGAALGGGEMRQEAVG